MLPSSGVLVLVFLWYMMLKEDDSSRSGVSRILQKSPIQPIKIIIVAWQILTEASFTLLHGLSYVGHAPDELVYEGDSPIECE